MRKSNFNEFQIAAILKEADREIPITEVLHNHSISAATICKCRYKYDGPEAS